MWKSLNILWQHGLDIPVNDNQSSQKGKIMRPASHTDEIYMGTFSSHFMPLMMGAACPRKGQLSHELANQESRATLTCLYSFASFYSTKKVTGKFPTCQIALIFIIEEPPYEGIN